MYHIVYGVAKLRTHIIMNTKKLARVIGCVFSRIKYWHEINVAQTACLAGFALLMIGESNAGRAVRAINFTIFTKPGRIYPGQLIVLY